MAGSDSGAESQAELSVVDLPAVPTVDAGWIVVQEGFTLVREHELGHGSRSETAAGSRGSLANAARCLHQLHSQGSVRRDGSVPSVCTTVERNGSRHAVCGLTPLPSGQMGKDP